MDLKSIGIPSYAKKGAELELKNIGIPAFDFIDSNPVLRSISIPINLYCLQIVNQIGDPVVGAEVTIEGDPQIFITNSDGVVFIGAQSGVFTASKPGEGSTTKPFDFTGEAEGTCLVFALPPNSGMSIKLSAPKLPSITEINTNDICYCDFECEYVEMAFAFPGGEFWKNDKSSFLFQKIIASDSIDFELWKNKSKIADLNDNTYGVYYPSFSSAPLYKAFLIDWEKVFSVSGAGIYEFKAIQTILGAPSEFVSRKFQLLPYDDILADQSVRIESYQTGNIVSSDFDFTDLLPGGWYQSFRINGKFGDKTPVLEVDNYLSSQYELLQIQDKINNEYLLDTHLIPSVISNMLVYNSILANKILITDYNFMSPELYRRVEVYPVSFENVSHYGFNRNTRYQIKFTDKRQNIIKRNF